MGEKTEQILVIEPPNELTFIGPFTHAVSSVMKLSNPSDRKICFKIKTTAPKRYCVKPNSGVIDPQQTVQISVSLQPFEFDPSEKNKHKFMVQSMMAPDGEINQDTLWKETDPRQLMDSKLRCVFLMPEIENNRDDNGGPASSEFQQQQQQQQQQPKIPPSPKTDSSGYGTDSSKRQEIIKLQEENSALRQENIQLKEEALRQKRLAANRSSGGGGGAANSSSDSVKPSSSTSASSYSATSVMAGNPNANALSPAHMYAALIILILGVIVGKWIL